MKQTLDWLQAAEEQVRTIFMELRPQLLDKQARIQRQVKDDKTSVTEMDFLVENTLRDKLAKFDGGVGFSGEETGVDYDRETFWLVDPIDGTESYVRGLPFSTNVAALIHQGEALLSIIYNFTTDEYFMAIKGQGTTLNGQPIHVSERPIERASFAMTRPVLRALAEDVSYVVQADGGSYEHTLVARGAIEGRITVGGRGKPWDYAPGALLVAEAGGRVANIGKDSYSFRDKNFIATNAIVFDEMMLRAEKVLHRLNAA